MRIFNDTSELLAATGEELGTSDWLVVGQERINAFADATGDQQWIHVDPEKAAEGPFGNTIAHGFLTLSLLPSLLKQIYRVDGVRMTINYGVNKVRMPAPVPAGAKLRARSRLAEAFEVDGAVQAVLSTTIEVEGGTKPACVVDSVLRYIT